MTKLLTKKEVTGMTKALEAFSKENGNCFTITKTDETVKVLSKDKTIFRSLKTNGPWLTTFDSNLFES